MRLGGRASKLLVVLTVALALPAAAWGHASLLAAQPQASGVLSQPPTQVSLTFSEHIEPRFAVISVTDAHGNQVMVGSPANAPGDQDTIFIKVRNVPQGWYLVWWRVISADGHPVRGAFTFAVGPSPGPPPQFVIPSLGESAATPSLVGSRWALLLAVLASVGLLAFRAVIVRPLLVAGGSERALHSVNVAAGIALAVALVAAPVYLVLATAEFSLRPWTDLGAVVPLVRDSGFGRAFSDLWGILALLAAASAVALALDLPGRARRSGEALLALIGAGACAAAALALPGLAGHPSTTSPVGLMLALDWAHLAAASIWIGGLLGILVLAAASEPGKRVAALAVVVPRFSRAAMVSVAVLLATGVVVSIVHLPTLASLWQTTYGLAIIAKSALLAAALVLGAVNNLRSRPRLVAAVQRRDQALGERAAQLLLRLVLGESALLFGAVAAAAILTSLAPPSSALAKVGKTDAHVGPGAVARTFTRNGVRIQVGIRPNRAAIDNAFALRLERAGKPVRNAQVTAQLDMLDMSMQQQAYTLAEVSPGVYQRNRPAFVMVGHWLLGYTIEIPGRKPIKLQVLDKAGG
ncbi:MAG TPA: copper resistance protein CopC [Gaiellales bacterium]|jgi:copper transport protein|nr:copper resistance protein CopC [Gaiellales bacterium]